MITIQLTPQELDIVMAALQNSVWRFADPVIRKILAQANSQERSHDADAPA